MGSLLDFSTHLELNDESKTFDNSKCVIDHEVSSMNCMLKFKLSFVRFGDNWQCVLKRRKSESQDGWMNFNTTAVDTSSSMVNDQVVFLR